MLKTAGLPGSDGQSAAISLLDWYALEHELILVLERPAYSLDLHKYLQINGGSLPEHEAKVLRLCGGCFCVCVCRKAVLGIL